MKISHWFQASDCKQWRTISKDVSVWNLGEFSPDIEASTGLRLENESRRFSILVICSDIYNPFLYAVSKPPSNSPRPLSFVFVMSPICRSMEVIARSTSVGHPSGLGSARIHAPSTCSPAYATWRVITSHHLVCARQIVLQKGYPRPPATWTHRQKGAQVRPAYCRGSSTKTSFTSATSSRSALAT